MHSETFSFQSNVWVFTVEATEYEGLLKHNVSVMWDTFPVTASITLTAECVHTPWLLCGPAMISCVEGMISCVVKSAVPEHIQETNVYI